MFEVQLLNHERFDTNVGKQDETSEAYALSQLAGATCYQPDLIKAIMNAKLDVKKTLYDTGHHTTLQHSHHYLSFHLDNIPVSLVTFGLHLTHPFYNSSQRSGRYCVDMFKSGFDDLSNYAEMFIDKFCTTCQHPFAKGMIMMWLKSGYDFYTKNIEAVTAIAKQALIDERPNYKMNIDRQAYRIAQDQLRCVISTIMPTGMIHTLNLTSLLAMNQVAWSSPLAYLLGQMCDTIRDSDLGGLDQPSINNRFYPEFLGNHANVVRRPYVRVHKNSKALSAAQQLLALYRGQDTTQVLDTLYFDPNTNATSAYADSSFAVDVEVPVVTFGQDQRHRMIKRSNPSVTGNFYLPPLVAQLPDAEKFCKDHMNQYLELARDSSSMDMIHFIPYGAMVSYTKECDVRAYLHSCNKRFCYNAESCISQMERETVRQLYDIPEGGILPLGSPCKNGRCHEGKRFCGRDLNQRQNRKLI